jgi:hypothetical protein
MTLYRFSQVSITALVISACLLTVGMIAVAPDAMADPVADDAGPIVDKQPTPKPQDGIGTSPVVEFATKAVAHARAGNWWGVFGAALLLVVLALRLAVAHVGKVGRWVTGNDAAGFGLTLFTSFAGMLGTAWVASASPGLADVKAALLFAVVAAGGWSVLWKRLAVPVARGVMKRFA